MGVYKSDSWKKASIFNPLTGDVALMTTLIGGETFLAPLEEIVQETTNGNYISQWRHRVQFACSDWDAFDTLQGFKDGHVAVQAVAAAEIKNCANLQWYESVKIKELRKVPKPRRADGDSHFIVVLEYEGDENAAIFNNVNLLHQANVNGIVVTGFVDSNGNGNADGYTNSGLTNASFEDGVQEVETTRSTAHQFRNVTWPLAGSLLLSANHISGVNSTARIGSAQYNFSDVSINSSEIYTAIPNRVKHSISVSATIYKVQTRPLYSGLEGVYEYSKPCLRTDGSSEYIAG